MIARMKDTSKYFAIKAVNKSFIQKVVSSVAVSFAGRICQGSHGGAECAGPSVAGWLPAGDADYGVFLLAQAA